MIKLYILICNKQINEKLLYFEIDQIIQHLGWIIWYKCQITWNYSKYLICCLIQFYIVDFSDNIDSEFNS